VKKYSNIKIAHISTVHIRTDTRIFLKELQTLSQEKNYELYFIVADGLGDDKKNNINIIDIAKKRQTSRFIRIFLTSFTMFNRVLKLKPKLVHFHDPELIPIAILLKFWGIKIIYDAHEHLYKQILGKRYIPRIFRGLIASLCFIIERFGIIFFDAVIGANPDIQKSFKSKKVHLLRNLPFKSEFHSIDTTNYLQRPNKICFIGNITKIRGIDEVLDSISFFKKNEVSFDLAGRFEPKEYGLELSENDGWKKTNFYEWVNRHEMARILSESRAGIVTYLPYPNHIDAQPNKLFEYMSAGIPVIASDFPMWRNLIEESNCGILVDPSNSKEIFEAIKWILENPKESKEMGIQGKIAIEKKYNWDIEKMNLLKIYKEVLSIK
tara:strand:+ start:8856 stop:9995 length:1140 start_codon:yes stop_codon:yes gene_type:complete